VQEPYRASPGRRGRRTMSRPGPDVRSRDAGWSRRPDVPRARRSRCHRRTV
jgi:hypothetical protein